jgi:hypothetical protein
MTAPVLINVVQIAWMSLLKHQQISGMNIEMAPLRLLSAIMEASAGGEDDRMALVLWNSNDGTISLH